MTGTVEVMTEQETTRPAPLTSAERKRREELGRNNLGLAYHIARTFRRGPLGEEAVSVAMLGLAQAVNVYDPARGCAFSTLASLCITRALLNALAASDQRKRQRQTGRPDESVRRVHNLRTSEYDDRPLDCLGNLDANLANSDVRDALAQVQRFLRPGEWRLLSMHYLEGRTHREVARIMHCSSQRVQQKIKIIIARIRRRMGNGDSVE